MFEVCVKGIELGRGKIATERATGSYMTLSYCRTLRFRCQPKNNPLPLLSLIGALALREPHLMQSESCSKTGARSFPDHHHHHHHHHHHRPGRLWMMRVRSMCRPSFKRRAGGMCASTLPSGVG
eukprot:905535-Pelagomonas_calceolata.AAC.1